MFTGIIEAMGEVVELRKERNNLHITIQSSISQQLKIDQSVAHNGVCLTVVNVDDQKYTVTAIQETLTRSNLGSLKKGDHLNLERCLKASDRLDGHIVQGHVDDTAEVTHIEDQNGSWLFTFRHSGSGKYLLIEKGSVAINGVSLTVAEAASDIFSVAIIPYTFEHTNFKDFSVGDKVNIEYDIIGKYLKKHIEAYQDVMKS